jgi:hypothetical protein
VILPSPSLARPLIICAYTTGTSTSNRLFINGNGNVDGQTIAIQPNSGPCCGLFLISNGSAWYIVGLFLGSTTSFESLSENRNQQTSTLFATSTTDGCRTPDTLTYTSGDAGLFWVKYTGSQNLPLVVNSPNYKTVNNNFNRFFRNGDFQNAGYCYIVHNRGGSYFTLPITMYPSEY